jgi:hypothetical protein
MTRHLHWPIWIEWSIIQAQSSALTLGLSKAASPSRNNQSRPVVQWGAISSESVAWPNCPKTRAAHRNDAPLWSTKTTNHWTIPTAYC